MIHERVGAYEAIYVKFLLMKQFNVASCFDFSLSVNVDH